MSPISSILSRIFSFSSRKKTTHSLPAQASVWTEATMGVEVKTLDDEHRRLAELIQELQDAIKKRLDIGEVSRIFTRISEGARAHCISEEDILAENKYPQLEEHREAHRKWLEEIKALHLNLRNGQMSHSLAPGKLEIWFAEHIVHEDRKYASYLRARNV